jgi:hypothetical protein
MRLKMEIDITLNLPYDLTPVQWKRVVAVYESMDGWIGVNESDNTPQWYGRDGDERFVGASVEPSGLLVFGNLEHAHWTGWVSVLCARLSLALQMEIRDASM